jgi:cilia- and flagella-associated protein 52
MASIMDEKKTTANVGISYDKVDSAAAATAAATETDIASSGPQALPLRGVIGFNGHVPAGFALHPDDEHVIFPLGGAIVVRNLLNDTQYFLQKGGHDRPVSCLALSASGKYLASGQLASAGRSADVIIWNLETCEIAHKLEMHKDDIVCLAFSYDDKFLASVSCGPNSRLILWDVETGRGLAGAKPHNEEVTSVKFFNNDSSTFVTGGDYNLRVWKFNEDIKKTEFNDVNLGSIKRKITSFAITSDDSGIICGTTTGDLLDVRVSTLVMSNRGPTKRTFSGGILQVALTQKDNVIVGCGDGTVAIVIRDGLKVAKRVKLDGGISSLQLNDAGDHFFAATLDCNIYLVELKSFDYELRNTCHTGRINDVAFPQGYSDLFATCGRNDIRVWNANTCVELLRINVPNLECLCVAFMPDGKSVLSGWDDGKIRAFKPQSGALLYSISDAHNGGVSAIIGSQDSHQIISGGRDGRIRVWGISAHKQTMEASLKEHKSTVNSIQLSADGTECVSAAEDGSCIVWNLERHVRNSALFASTQFRCVQYHPDQSQLLTVGTDRKITYWDAVESTPIRILDASPTAEINALSISSDGERFVCGGGEKLIKVWSYDEGFCYHVGVGHSGVIRKAVISPSQDFVVSADDQGGVFIWDISNASVPEAVYE